MISHEPGSCKNQYKMKLACTVYPLALIHIGFVPYQDLVDIIRSVLFDITNPVPNICNKVKKTGPEKSKNVKIKDVMLREKQKLLLKDDSSVTS